jgi:branched-chain amino acid transport system substrate-binding protein
MSTRRGFLIGSTASAAAALQAHPALAAFSTPPPFAPTITLGVVGPMTGDERDLGLQLADGAQQAVNEGNQFRGSLDPYFTLRTFDDQNLLAQAIITAQFAVDDPSVLCVIGHLSGRTTEAALQTYTNASMPVIIPASTYEKLTAHGYSGILRLNTKDSTEGQLAAAYFLRELHPTSVAVLYQDGDYGFDVAHGFTDQMHADKIPCALIKCNWEKPRFDTIAAQTLAANPTLIYLAGSVTDMGSVIGTLRAAKYTGRFAASQGFFSAVTTDKYAPGTEGLIVSSSIPPFRLAPSDLRIIQDFQQNYGSFTPLSALGYAGTQIAMSAIRRTGSRNRAALWRALQNPTATYNTVIGSLSFLSNGDQVQPNMYFYEVKDGKWSYVRSAHPSDFLVQ